LGLFPSEIDAQVFQESMERGLVHLDVKAFANAVRKLLKRIGALLGRSQSRYGTAA
jgi:hypothetical protein